MAVPKGLGVVSKDTGQSLKLGGLSHHGGQSKPTLGSGCG
jgi:hypothetical protein